MSDREAQAVIVVDLQADFTEFRNGTLAVPGTGSDYVEQVVARTREFRGKGLPILATRDYHPPDHVSFFTLHPGKQPLDVIKIQDREQVLWPPHCIQGTPGAEILLPPDLITAVISTGNRAEFESYSGFRDDGGRDTGLKGLLQEYGTRSLIIYGLATDYCVSATVLHAREESFDVTLLLDLSRGITPESTRKAVEEMRAAGARIEE